MSSGPTQIALLGANGQVASEVALHLAACPDVHVHGLVRSQYGSILLDLAGIPVSELDYSAISPSAKQVLHEADTVVDCAYPGGQPHEIARNIETNVEAVMRCMRRGTHYLHASSISAFGMPMSSSNVRAYRFARTGYARIKRQAERAITRHAAARGLHACHLRLGQVHGVLQSVTREIRTRISGGGLAVAGAPDSLSTTVFAHAVGQAFLRAAEGELPHGSITTVVSSPQWCLDEVFNFYRKLTDIDFPVDYVSAPEIGARSPIAARGIALVTPFRHVLESQLLPHLPALVPKLKGQYRLQATRRECSHIHAPHIEPAMFQLTGMPPGRLVEGIHSTPQETMHAFRAVETRLADMLRQATS